MSDVSKFQKLTPNTEIDTSGYKEAFDFIFHNNDIKNIAISGPYGSGKSSLIESYKKTIGKEHSFMHISLAHFRGNEEEQNDSGDDSEIVSPNRLSEEAVLEGKIINHLIHQIPVKKIEQTSFKVKNKIRKRDIIPTAVLIVLFVLSLALITFSSQLTVWADSFPNETVKVVLLSVFGQYGQLVCGIVAVVSSVFFICNLVKAQKIKNLFKKINVNGNEIEIFENQDDSYFDKYLNEILYLFDNIEQDVIVFEDLDRYKSVEIFERLHEINALINLNRTENQHTEDQRTKKQHIKFHLKDESKTKKTIRFFYLIRDDMFVSKDRTKFFDFIIPVVPVINSSNSYTQLSSFLKEGCVADGLNEGFLQSLSLYIDDMRLLKNICNEYIIYLCKINTTELNKNKLLAMITYKNLFPRDFSELQFGRGFVHEVLSSKNKMIDFLVAECEAKEKQQQDKIDKIRKEVLDSIEDLNIVCQHRKERISSYYTERRKNIEDEFAERKQIFQESQERNIPSLEAEIQRLESQKAQYKNVLFKDLITNDNIDELFSASTINELGEVIDYKDIKRSDYFDLLKFLIREGYIDETYCDYMSFFYEGGICANDKIYLRRITDRRGRAYEYPITNPDVVLSSSIFRPANFEQEETLNFDLLAYLLANRGNESYKEYLSVLIKQIKDNQEYDFVSQFYNTDKCPKDFVEEINTQWQEFFGLMMTDSHFTAAQIKNYSMDTLYYCPETVITGVNIDNCLTEYISENNSYLEIDEPDIDALISGFYALDVSFVSFDYEKSNKSLFDAVYHGGFYEINYDNIRLMLVEEYHVHNDADIKHKMATLILSEPETPLSKRMHDEIVDFVNVILDNCNGVITDEQNIAITMLNFEDVDISLRTKYIEYLTTVIPEISSVENKDLWSSLLEGKNVDYSSSNIVGYFESFGLNNTLVEFINSSDTPADFSDVSNSFSETTAEKLFDEILKCNSISTNFYKSALLELGFIFEDFTVSGIDEDKMRILINEGVIVFNANNMDFIRKNYSEIRYVFIMRNISEYVSLQDEVYNFEETRVLLSKDIDEEEKLRLLDYANGTISIDGKDYSDKLIVAIINNHLCASDEPILFERYSSYAEDVQDAIYKAALERVHSIVDYERKIDFALLSRLLSGNMDFDFKIDLFDYSLKFINEEECKTLFSNMGYVNLSTIIDQYSSRRKYENTEEIGQIFEALKKHGWISDYHETNDNPPKLSIVKAR